MDPVRFILVCLAGWINREQQSVIEYLREEIHVLRELLGSKKVRFSDDQRRRLARKAKQVKFGRLKEIANLATPQTLLAWFRRLVATNYDSSAKRVGRPRMNITPSPGRCEPKPVATTAEKDGDAFRAAIHLRLALNPPSCSGTLTQVEMQTSTSFTTERFIGG